MAKQNLTPRINRLESNIVIDGGHEIWPEGTSRSVANNTSAYGSVLFQYNNVSSGVTVTNSRQSSVPSGTNLIYSNQVSKTAAGTLAAGTRSIMHYHIEGFDLQRIWNNEFTLIFWVKSSVASNRSVSLRNASASHSYVQQYNIAAANTWELKAIRFPAMSSCPGAVNRDNALGAIIGWDIVTGSTYQTSSLNQWVAGNFSSGIGENTTWLTGTNHDFSIAGVMVLPGDWSALTASGYNFIRAGRNIQGEVAMSQRYFEKSFDTDTTPGTATNIGSLFILTTTAFGGPGATNRFKLEKRATPSIVIYNPNSGASGSGRGSAGADRAATATNIGTSGFEPNFTSPGVNEGIRWHFVADVRF